MSNDKVTAEAGAGAGAGAKQRSNGESHMMGNGGAAGENGNSEGGGGGYGDGYGDGGRGGRGGRGADLARQGSKFRLIEGSSIEDGAEQIQQGYDNYHHNNYYHNNNYHHNNYNSYRGGRGYYNGGGRGYYRGRGRGRGRGYNYGGGYGRGRYGYSPRWHGGRGRYNRHSYSNGFYNSSGYNDHHYNNHSYSSGFNNTYHNDAGYAQEATRKDFYEPSGFRKGNVQTRLVVGGGADDSGPDKDTCTMEIIPQTYNEELHQLESLQGTVALDTTNSTEANDSSSSASQPSPLVVMDGTNLCYSYGDAMGSKNAESREPNFRGMQVASDYFLSAGIRVLIVLPAHWFRVKSGDHSKETTIIKINVLQDLKEKGLLVAAPPGNENDAVYALTIARNAAKRYHTSRGGGYVLSNDTFQDIIEDDARAWLMDGNGKISFAFCDMGSVNSTGGRMLDFIPNPKHPLVGKLEKEYNGNNSD